MDTFISIIGIVAASVILSVIFSIKGKLLPLLGFRLACSTALVTSMALLKFIPLNALIVAATGTLGTPGFLASLFIVRFL